jgi:general secretion pathway protein F
MPIFDYHGFDAKGAKKSGTITADSPSGAGSALKKKGIMITGIKESSARGDIFKNPLKALASRVTPKDIALFNRQLSTLLSGGLSLVESLAAIREQAGTPAFARLVGTLREDIVQGRSLASSLEKHAGSFDALTIGLVKAGEASGTLDATLSRLADFHETKERQKSKVISALIYPVIMGLVGSLVLVYLLTSIVPKVELMFEDMNQALPLATIILLAISRFLTEWWPVLLAALCAFGLWFDRYRQSGRGKKVIDRYMLKIPIVGNLVKASSIARFTRALGVLLTGGVPLIEALKVTSEVTNHATISEAIDKAIVSITEGESIASPLKSSGLFPPLVTQMISAGERSGSLPVMLEKIADAYEFEVDTAAERMTSLVEPLMILFMGSVVGFIVMAILLPIFELSQGNM